MNIEHGRAGGSAGHQVTIVLVLDKAVGRWLGVGRALDGWAFERAKKDLVVPAVTYSRAVTHNHITTYCATI